MSNRSPFIPPSDPSGHGGPVNPLPPVVVALALLLAGIELYFQAGSYGLLGQNGIGARVNAIQDFGFFDTVFEAMRLQGQWPLSHVMRFFTYAFVGGAMTQTVFVIVFLLALGNMVGRHFGQIAVVAIFAISTVAGSLAYGFLVNSEYPLIGGYPGVYGLIGGYTFMLYVGLGQLHQNQMRAFSLIGMLMGIQLLFGVIFGGTADWVADLAGFTAGLITATLMVPGAFRRILERIRKR
ncbi:Rhomboid family protein [Aquimixticola soesokkakensis]|uniref:Rhomboid family protein n=1 Tax=Aquimixticola soesokkakensis TaxID=1519096 RepID=A0A1Y5T5R2_9RHOB|nr:rhomboid family intramembrane serine protease [Aquimixticola soesokkakensis]SLN53121.1 Rhomboid family protein [Aquimixticola soesokkakensis]